MWKVKIWAFKKEPRWDNKRKRWLDKPNKIITFCTKEFPDRPEVIGPYIKQFPNDWFVYYDFWKVRNNEKLLNK